MAARRAYGAKTTSHMLIITPDGVAAAYKGAINDDRPATKFGKINYVAVALKALWEGEKIEPAQTPACSRSVKYGH